MFTDTSSRHLPSESKIVVTHLLCNISDTFNIFLPRKLRHCLLSTAFYTWRKCLAFTDSWSFWVHVHSIGRWCQSFPSLRESTMLSLSCSILYWLLLLWTESMLCHSEIRGWKKPCWPWCRQKLHRGRGSHKFYGKLSHTSFFRETILIKFGRSVIRFLEQT